MPIRGKRSIYPATRRKPTGMFSRGDGKQKMDSTSQFPNQGTMGYAHSMGSRSKPKSSGGSGLRHQSPKKGW